MSSNFCLNLINYEFQSKIGRQCSLMNHHTLFKLINPTSNTPNDHQMTGNRLFGSILVKELYFIYF